MSSDYQASQFFDLGMLLSEHKGRVFSRFFLAAALIGLGVLAVGGALLTLTQDISTSLCIGVPGLVALIGGLFLSYKAFIERDFRVSAFKEGIVETKGGIDKVTRWDDIVAVWQAITHHKRYGITVRTTHLYTVQLANNEKLKFKDNLKNVEQLGNTIQQEVVNRLLPKAVETLKIGGTVDFGKLSVNSQGLSNGKEVIPWEQVKKVSINNGYITVRKEGKLFNWSNVTVAQTPNVFVFLSLVDQIVGVNK